MLEIKWIKLTTTMFEDEKIDFIESLPEADAILIIWIKLLTLAGKCNSNGYIFLTENIPYDENMLAHKFKRPINTVKMALETFERLGMLGRTELGLCINNWEKHQNIQGMERIKEQNRIRQQRFKANQNLLESNVTLTLPSQSNNAVDIDIDKEYIYISSEQNCSKQDEVIFLTMTLNDKSEYGITENQVSEWKELYPAVDIGQELRNMKGWLIANPKKRKTKSGILRFITSWLSRTQDKGGNINTNSNGSKYKEL